MKTLVKFLTVLGLLANFSSCKIVNPFLIALNLPLEACGTITSGGQSWNETETFDIMEEIEKIDVSYADDIKATRLATIRVYMKAPVPSGTASGFVYYQLPGGSQLEILRFTNLTMSRLAEPGVSMLDPTAVQYNAANLASLIAAFTSSDGLPGVLAITVSTNGTTSGPVPAGTSICVRFEYQADAEVSF